MAVEFMKEFKDVTFIIEENRIAIDDGKHICLDREQFDFLCRVVKSYDEMVKLEKELD